MPQLSSHGEQANRGASVEGLEPRGAVGMPQSPTPDVTGFPPSPNSDPMWRLDPGTPEDQRKNNPKKWKYDKQFKCLLLA